MKIEVLDLEKVKEIIIEWAKVKKYITKVYIFGSRLCGFSKKTGQPVRSDSDLDVAVEFDKLPGDENCFITWVGEADKWREELSEMLNLKNEIKLHLEWHDPVQTSKVYQYLKDGSVLIYDRSAGMGGMLC